jgi:ABC-type Fe3+ transport system permease subunit
MVRRVFGILAPLVAPSILVSWAVTFLFCLRDVSLPLLFAPPGYDALAAEAEQGESISHGGLKQRLGL